MTYRPAIFRIEDDTPYPGITDGSSWNGFECPLFTRETVERMIVDCPHFPLVYDATIDAFIDDAGGDELGTDTEIFKGEEVNGTTYYGVGAGSWVWTEVLPDDEDEDGVQILYASEEYGGMQAAIVRLRLLLSGKPPVGPE